MTTRRSKRAPRRRPYVVFFNPQDSNASNTRESIATPNKGKRVRLIRVKLLQETADGRHLYEIYFGTGTDITTAPAKGIDILEVPDLGEDETQTYLRDEGPRGARNEVLSGRWAGTAPTSSHKVLVEYEEEN